VATAEKWRDKQTGDIQERTEWHNIVAFNKIAEVISQYLVKGSKVYIEGQLKTDKWQDNNGNDRWTTSIVVRDMLMLDGPQGAQNAPGATQQAPQQSAPRQQSAPQQQAPRQQQAAPPQQQQIPDDFDDDIPF
jgi:single-strand DNA-binding protein